MPIHTTSGRWKLGLLLSLVTTLCWGVLPIALKIMLGVMDAATLTWYRFLTSALILSIFILPKFKMDLKNLRGRWIWLFLIAALCLCGNYVIYLMGLNLLTPSVAQVVIQLAPMLLLLGGLFIFREKFSILQWTGFGIFVIGLLLFFNERILELFETGSQYALGVLFIVIAAFSWATYGLAQKQLLRIMSSQSIMLLIYIFAVFFFLPMTKPAQINTLDATHLIILAFCAINTLIAYGSFAEALAHWEASRVGAVITLVPILTVAGMHITAAWRPDLIAPEHLSAMNLIGGLLVIVGSILCALGKNQSA